MKSKTWWIVGAIVVVAVIIGAVVWYENTPGEYDQFAECIAKSGATFYGAFWCPHCEAQKAMFGKSADKLPYVECSTPDGQSQNQVCTDKGIMEYPTWFFANSSSTTGVLDFGQLSQATGCALPKQ